MLLLLFPMLLQLFLMAMLPVVVMLLTLSELSMLPREKLKQSLKLMPFMHLMDTEDLGTLVLDTPDLMALDMDILTTAKLFSRSST